LGGKNKKTGENKYGAGRAQDDEEGSGLEKKGLKWESMGENQGLKGKVQGLCVACRGWGGLGMGMV